MDDTVPHVKLYHLATELTARIATKLQRQTQGPIPNLQDGLEYCAGALVGDGHRHVVGGGLARHTSTG